MSKILHKLCVHNLVPRNGYNEEVTKTDLLVIYHLLRMEPISLPYLILNHILNITQPFRNRICLPYGMALTKVFRLVGIDLSPQPYYDDVASFDSQNLIQLGIELNPSIPEQSELYADEEARVKRKFKHEAKLRKDLEERFGDISDLLREMDHGPKVEPTKGRRIEHMILGASSHHKTYPRDVPVNKLLLTYPKDKSVEHELIGKDSNGKETIHEDLLSNSEETQSSKKEKEVSSQETSPPPIGYSYPLYNNTQ